MAIRLDITDDHPLAISGLQNMLLAYESIRVQHTYASGKELLSGLEKEQPDVLLLDIMLPDIKGRELAEIIHGKYPSVKILAITSLDAPVHVKAMMRNGCSGYLLKNTDVQTLIHAIEEVHAGREYIEPSLKEQIIQNVINFRKTSTSEPPLLTRREKEILQLIIEENTNQQIADKLFLSLRTVENHRLHLQQKLNVHNNIGLVKTAIQLGLVE